MYCLQPMEILGRAILCQGISAPIFGGFVDRVERRKWDLMEVA